MTRRRRRTTLAALTATLALTAGACGSQVSPETVRAANGQTGITGAGSGTVAGDIGNSGTTGDLAGSAVASIPGSGASDTSGGAGGVQSPASVAGEEPSTGGVNATGGVKAASCDGFKNQTGVTDKTITIANASDISGPMPGLFQASQDATKAYVAYFNATSDICGRKLELLNFDSRTDAGADQQAYASACEQAFAAVGSMSAYDSGGAATAQGCGLPDLRAISVTPERGECGTCFAASSNNPGYFENAVPDYALKYHRDASQKAAMVYLNIGAAATAGPNQARAQTKRGMNFIYTQALDVSEFNYAPYVQQMKDKGVEYVQYLGSYQSGVRLAQAMQQSGFKPEVFMMDPTAYDPGFVQSGGSAVEGTTMFVNFTPFEDSSNKELQLYKTWLQQVHPGASPTFFGLFSWSATRLFVEQSAALGGGLTRAALLQRLRSVSGWTDNGLHAPQYVGAKKLADCWRFLKLTGGRWVPTGGTAYSCHGTTAVN